MSDINLKSDKQIPVHWENKEEDIEGRGTNSNIQQHYYEELKSSSGSVGGFKWVVDSIKPSSVDP